MGAQVPSQSGVGVEETRCRAPQVPYLAHPVIFCTLCPTDPGLMTPCSPGSQVLPAQPIPVLLPPLPLPLTFSTLGATLLGLCLFPVAVDTPVVPSASRTPVSRIPVSVGFPSAGPAEGQ